MKTAREAEAITEARDMLRRIEENIDKRHYWNAITYALVLTGELLKAFDCVLKHTE
jgi:hypothetical protein